MSLIKKICEAIVARGLTDTAQERRSKDWARQWIKYYTNEAESLIKQLEVAQTKAALESAKLRAELQKVFDRPLNVQQENSWIFRTKQAERLLAGESLRAKQAEDRLKDAYSKMREAGIPTDEEQ